MRPMVVFKRSDLKEDLIQGEVLDTIYGLSKSGWMDGDCYNSQGGINHFITAKSQEAILQIIHLQQLVIPVNPVTTHVIT